MPDPRIYVRAFNALLPPGRLWPIRSDSNLQRLFAALAARLAAVHLRADQLLVELYPPTTLELIADWEAMLGLPDECAAPAATIQERRIRILHRLTKQPRPTIEYFQEMAQTLGYSGVTFEETDAYELTVNVPNPRAIYFRCGESACGDRLVKIDRAEDLECLLRIEKQAHIRLVFNYLGL